MRIAPRAGQPSKRFIDFSGLAVSRTRPLDTRQPMKILPFLVAGVALIAAAGPAGAQAPSDEIAVMRAQIQQLSARLAELEARQSATPAPVRSNEALPLPPASPPATAIAMRPAAAQPTTADWSSGLPEFRSPDGAFTFRPRVRVTADASTTVGSDYDTRKLTGTELRGFRIGASGKMPAGFNYWIEADLSDNAVSLKNAFLGYSRRFGGRDLDLSFGQRLNDRGVEGGTAEDVTPFLERSYTAAVLGPERGGFGMGAMARLTGEVWHASLSLTGDGVSDGQRSDSVSLMGRMHWALFKSDDGFVHVGGWGFIEDIASGQPSVARNLIVGANFNDNLRLASGSYVAPKSSVGYGLELGGVLGSGWVMFEGGRRTIETFAAEFDQDVATLASGWFLTGETPPLSARSGSWQRPRVLRPLGPDSFGAFELVARYDQADFSDNPLGGEGETTTIGLNWYPTNNTRVSMHWAHWSVTNRSGAFTGSDTGDTATVRVQAAF